MKILRIDRGYRHLKRYRQIVGVFVKYGFAEILDRLDVAARLRLKTRLTRKAVLPDQHLTAAQRLRMALEELGPTFIKIGQLLSTRSFLLPPEFLTELAKLQDQVAPVPFDEVKELIEEELGASIDVLFDEFNTEPIASASIAQAYRARLYSGEDVVVKVQRPNIARVAQVDMEILHDLSVLLERHVEESRQYEPVEMVEELTRTMHQEIDFTNEARNIEQFRNNFKKSRTVYVPNVYWEYCSRRIVTLEFIKGIKVSNIDELERLGINLSRVAHIGTQFILKQVFEDGFFHADPHPGNLFLTQDEKIAPVDFGIMGRIDDVMMDEISDLSIGIWRRDVDLIIRVFTNLGAVELDVEPHKLRTELSEFLNKYYGLPLNRIDMRALFNEGLEIISRHHLRVPSNLLLLVKTVGTYEDMGRRLDPNYNFLNEISPYVKKLIFRRLSPEKISYETGKALRDLYDLLKVMPRELEIILRRMRRGKMAIELQHRGLEKLINEMDRSFNRLSYSLTIASLIIASSLIMLLNKGPLLFGYPLLGVVGYLFAGILGVGLAIAILRSGKF